jgi:hypothetical protein
MGSSIRRSKVGDFWQLSAAVPDSTFVSDGKHGNDKARGIVPKIILMDFLQLVDLKARNGEKMGFWV